MSRLLIIGGGFAGVGAALSAAVEADENGGGVDITLVSDSAFITNRPRLYESLKADLRQPLAPTLEPVGVDFFEGRVSGIDVECQRVEIAPANGGPASLGYDRLVVAAGSRLSLPDIPGAAEYAWNIDTFEAAEKFDRHLRQRLRDTGPDDILAIVIVGAGLTGLELATEMRGRLSEHGGGTTAERARVVLIDRRREVGPMMEDGARDVVTQALEEAGVELRLETSLQLIERDAAVFDDGVRIEAATVVLTSGLRASPLADMLGGETDGLGRLLTDETLRVAGMGKIFAAGDIARAAVDDGGRAALMSCQHAGLMGRFAGYNAARDLLDLPTVPYRQERYVTCIDLGPAGALFTAGWERALQMQGAEAKALKKQIVLERVMPPVGSAAEILAAGKLQTG